MATTRTSRAKTPAKPKPMHADELAAIARDSLGQGRSHDLILRYCETGDRDDATAALSWIRSMAPESGYWWPPMSKPGVMFSANSMKPREPGDDTNLRADALIAAARLLSTLV